MYIIYLYIIYILFISLSVVSKILSQRTRRMYVTTLLLFVICYLLWLRPQRTASSGASWHVLRPYCYLLFVMIAHAKGCLVGGDQTCVTTLLLFVICYLLWLCPPRTAMRALLKEKNVSRCFAISLQSRGDSTAIALPSYVNRRFRCFTRRAGSLLPRAETTAASLQ